MATLKKILEINNYKSYKNYKWNNLSKHLSKNGNEKEAEFDVHFNTFFGENGAGKSAIVQILKSLSNNGEFIDSYPEKAILEFKDRNFVLANGLWENEEKLDKTEIVFFDTEFIATNIHTNGCRETALQKGAHTQNSGKLLIECDGEALRLKGEYENAKEKLTEFRNNNRDDLGFSLTGDELFVFESIEQSDDDEIQKMIDKLPPKISGLEKEIKQLNENKTQINEIQGIETIATFEDVVELPEESTLLELFIRDIKGETKNEASDNILEKVKTYKTFYEDHKDLNDSDLCPFCGYQLNTIQAKQMLSIYQDHFDETYAVNIKKYKTDVEEQVSNFESIKSSLESIPQGILDKQRVFTTISEKYQLKKIAEPPTVEKIKKDSFIKLLKNLNNLLLNKSVVFIEEDFQIIERLYTNLKVVIKSINKWIETNNKIIENFKGKNESEDKIDEEIHTQTRDLGLLRLTQEFFIKDKRAKYKKALLVLEEQKILVEKQNSTKENYEQYLERIPETTALKMQDLVNNHFKLNFTLKSETARIGTSKEFPFKFKIIDESGGERDINDGLSEGERQIISFAFFFAHLDNLEEKQRILVFDDPVNSVDARNLKVFVELIKQECMGNQVFIFTHHSLFYKYACKTLNCASFGIIKNNDKFGGSFIYREKPLVIEDKLQSLESTLMDQISNGEMNYTMFTMEHGHLLRYCVEDFIKNKILHWGKKDFTQVLDMIGTFTLSKDDLEVIRKIYDFCNWCNHLHPDKEEPASLNELKVYIEKFLEIRRKVA